MTTNVIEAPSPTATQRLADHVVDLRFEDLPIDVVAQVKTLLVHHLGVAFQGASSDDGKRAVGVATDLSETGGSTSIIGESRRVGLLDAVFANAFLMSHHGLDDFLMPGGLHPGVVVQSTALAVGERVAASGRDLIVAVVAGYDAMGKLGNTTWPWGAALPRRANAVFAPFGAAATTARLMDLPRETIADALGQAGQCGMGIIEGGEFPWVIHPLLARNGVLAAMLAAAGFPTAPTMVDGEHGVFKSFFGHVPEQLDERLATLGEEFEVSRAATKRYRSSGLNIVPMQLMLELVKTHELTADGVATVDVTLPLDRKGREDALEADLDHAGATAITRLASLRFQLAIILADGRIDGARYDSSVDAAFAAIIDKVQLHFEPRDEIRYARIEVTTTDGARHTADGDNYELPPVDPLNWLRAGGDKLFPEEQLRRLLDLIARLEDVDDARDVLACLTR